MQDDTRSILYLSRKIHERDLLHQIFDHERSVKSFRPRSACRNDD